MKAIVYKEFGSADVLRLEDVEQPVPKDNQLLIHVLASSVNALDRHAIHKAPLPVRLMTGNGVRGPKDQRLGADLAGRVEAVGSGVTQFQPGDEVFGVADGAFAEYTCAREDRVVRKPATLTFEQSAAVPVAALTALQGLSEIGGILPGQQVLIHGASGGVGTFAVQLAKAFGADVTAVCSTRNMEMVRSLGADHVVDYTKEDVTRSKRRYDLILAVNGYHSVLAFRRLLRPEGVWVLAGEGSNTHLLFSVLQALTFGPVLSRTSKQNMRFFICKPTQKDLVLVSELLQAGKVTPVIDRCYPLGETADAFRYMEEEHARGKVVISVG